MILTYKRKLILTKSQEQRIRSWVGTCRLVYNLGLEIRKSAYESAGKTVSQFDLMRQCTELRKEYKWINDVPADTLSSSIKRLEISYQKFFKNFRSGVGYPKFANKKKITSINLRQRDNIIRVSGNKINLHKIGILKINKDSPILGDIKNVIIKIEPTGFFVNIQCDNVPKKYESKSHAIGIDMGISHFCIDSNGNFTANPKHFKKYESKLRVENRALARKKKGSTSWKRQCKKLALLHHKIAAVRKDFLHKESTKISKQNSTVYIEDLNIRGMSKNTNLAKHILDAGWGTFKIMMEYKTTVIKVNPKYTSQTCNECGEKDAKSRISQSEFACTKCGHISNADVNAAKNILGKGVALNRQREALSCA